MKNKIFDIVLLIGLAALLALLNQFELLAKYAHFALIPIMAFYYLGIWVGKKRMQ